VRGVAGRAGRSTRWHFLIGGGFPVVTGGFPVVTWGSTSRFFAPPNSWQQHHKYNNRRRFSREPHRPNFAGVECAAHQHRPAPAQATCRGEPACGPFDATNDMIKLRCCHSVPKKPLDSELSRPRILLRPRERRLARNPRGASPTAKMLWLVPVSTGLAARAAVGRHQQLRMMASECPRLPEPEQSEQRQTATFAMG
jgi:hypothetical protein